MKRLKLIWNYAFHMTTDNNPPLEVIFKFIHGLDKKDFKKIYKRYRKTETGKKVFSRNYSVLDNIQKGTFTPGTFGAEFQRWLVEADGAVDVFKFSYPGKDGTDLGKFFKETIMQHDLIHFLNGYDTTPFGEVGVLSFNLAKEWRESYATVLYASFLTCLRNTFLPSKYPPDTSWWLLLKHTPIVAFCRLVIEGWRRGKRAPWILDVDWEQYLDVDLQQVKKELLLDDTPKYWTEVNPIWKKALKHYKDYAKKHGTTDNRT